VPRGEQRDRVLDILERLNIADIAQRTGRDLRRPAQAGRLAAAS